MVNILCALKAEAVPVIDHFQLKQIATNRTFRLFENHGIRLTVTGVGKSSVAAAAGYSFARSMDRQHAGWLNLGIAGHADLPLGSICLASKITDRARNESWYPPQIYRWPHHRAEIVTVEHPETGYPSEALYDMEASSFVATCVRFSVAEIVQSVKIVSDNRQRSAKEIRNATVQELVGSHLDGIQEFVEQMSAFSTAEQSARLESPALAEFLATWRFTATQTHQLRELLRRWKALGVSDSSLEVSRTFGSARDVLGNLRQRLDEVPQRVATP